MVDDVRRDVVATSPQSSPLQGSSSNSRRETCETLHGTLDSRSCFGEHFGKSLASMDLDDDDIKFLSNHLASGSKTGYGYVFARFSAFCEKFME